MRALFSVSMGALLGLFCLAYAGSSLAQSDPAMPSEHGMASAPRDTEVLARDLPPGTIVVAVRDQNGNPRPGQTVRLRIRRQSPAIGEKITSREGTSNNRGDATFSNLETSSEHSYAALVPFQGALYGSDYTPLRPDFGLRITVHTFPTTRSLEQTQVFTAGLVAIEPSDTVLKLELALDVVNMGRTTWLPDQYAIYLPQGTQAFEPWDRTTGHDAVDEGTLRFEQQGPVAVLVGTVRPGQHRAGFTFQLPNPGHRFFPWSQTDTAHFELGLPDRVARFTVYSDQAPGLRLVVPGFAEATASQGPANRPVMATSWTASGMQDRLPGVRVTLAGLRTRGTIPFLSVAATVALLIWGLLGIRYARDSGPAEEDREEAQNRLLDELWALERARTEGRIGPKTHASARRALVAALARLEQPRQEVRPRGRRPKPSKQPPPGRASKRAR